MTLCRLCNNDSLNPIFTVKDKYGVCSCPVCGLVQLVTKPSEAEIDAIYQDIYFSHGKYKDSDTLMKENIRRLKIVKKYVLEKSKILEVGCGMGEFVGFSKGLFEMQGFDISEHAIMVAKERNPDIADQLWSGQIEKQSFEPESFDGICMWDVIEHLWDFIPTVNKLLNALKPNGFLFISTPNVGSLNAKISGKYWAMMTPPEHMSFFNKTSAHFLFEKVFINRTKVLEWHSKGKWVNMGFLLYKVNRIKPGLIPKKIMQLFEQGILSELSIYVPTQDIQYVVIRKM
jgi:2-polyprenyl-3-methyl-5-hydroxy-6-metoxy-1,4-benzoquinol methylase